MSTSDNCKDGVSKFKDGIICDVNDKLQKMSTVNNKNDVSVCANCGKEGANNICNKCKQVKYCNAVCKKVHKKKHKKDCEEYIRLATEKHNEKLRLAADLHDEKLFKEPPSQYGDCPICFLRLPLPETGRRYKSCCGKTICSGCNHAPVYDNQGNEVADKKCPFCRTIFPKSVEEGTEREKKRAENGDSIAIHSLGNYYRDGKYGFPQDHTKALELFHQAGELGHSIAYNNIGFAYLNGEGVEVDKKKAVHYWELAAMGGVAQARHNLGCIERDAGNIDRAQKHYMIAIRGGNDGSLDTIKQMYLQGDASKDVYMTALQAYQEYLGEIKSAQRDEAATANEEYRYY